MTLLLFLDSDNKRRKSQGAYPGGRSHLVLASSYVPCSLFPVYEFKSQETSTAPPSGYHVVPLKHTEPGIPEPKEIRPPFSGPSLVFDPSDAKARKQALE